MFGNVYLEYVGLSPSTFNDFSLSLLGLAEMRSLVNDASGIRRLKSAGNWARVGRCRYQSNNIPIIKTIDHESVVEVNIGIDSQVELR